MKTTSPYPDFFKEQFKDVLQRLFSIPGVVRVGYGLKEKGNEVLQEYVLRVYVNSKRPLSEIPKDEVIPPVINGIKTDVHVLTESAPTKSLFTSKARAGEKLTTYEDLGGARISLFSGTITCLVRKNNQNYALSCGHCYSQSLRDAPYAGNGNLVFIPDTSNCDCLGIDCRDKAGVVDALGKVTDPLVSSHNVNFSLNGRDYEIDCGLALLENEVTCNNNIDHIGLLSQQIRDVLPDIILSAVVQVQKYGAVTGYTTGTITEILYVETMPGPVIHVMTILPSQGKAFKEEYEISQSSTLTIQQIIDLFQGKPVTARRANPADPTGRRLIFEGKIFSNHGDSGSAIVDMNRKLVGNLHKGSFVNISTTNGQVSVPTGTTSACFIVPTFSFLGLDPNTAIIQTVPSAGETIAINEEDFETDQFDLIKVEQLISSTIRGRSILDDFYQHGEELVQLIHHNRRVRFCWIYNKCPQFIVATISSAKRNRLEPFKKTLDGKSFITAFKKLEKVLLEEGSLSLQETLLRHSDFIESIMTQCENFQDVINVFTTREETLSLPQEKN